MSASHVGSYRVGFQHRDKTSLKLTTLIMDDLRGDQEFAPYTF